MPKGIETVLDGGFAVIDFVDPTLRGAGLTRLHEIGGPESVETLTREGPRRKYRVAEGNAREAGLLDAKSKTRETVKGDTGAADSLAAAHDEQRQNVEARQELPTSGGNTFVGTTHPADAITTGGEAAPPATTVGDSPGIGGLVSTPTHDQVVAHAAAARMVPPYVPAHPIEAQTLNQGLANDPGDPRWNGEDAPPAKPATKTAAKKAAAPKSTTTDKADKS